MAFIEGVSGGLYEGFHCSVILAVVSSVCMCRCLLWEAESRPPLADVLTSLLALLQPPTPQPQLSEKKPDFVHSDR